MLFLLKSLEDSQKCHTFALANREQGALDEWLSLRSAKPSTAVRIRQAPPKIEQSQKGCSIFIHFCKMPLPSVHQPLLALSFIVTED